MQAGPERTHRPPPGAVSCLAWIRLAVLGALTLPMVARAGGEPTTAAASLVSPAAAAALRLCERDGVGAWLRPGEDSLAVAGERAERGLYHVRVHQFWRGLPVLGAEVMVSTLADGTPVMREGRLLHALAPAPGRWLGAAQARCAAADAAGVTLGGWNAGAELAVARVGGRDRVVWRVRFEGPPAAAVRESWVDAETGGVLESVRLDRPAAALVYDPDPRGALREVALSGLVDPATRLR